MSVTLELRPEVEAAALEQAAAQGVPIETYMQNFFELNSIPVPTKPMTIEEVDAFLDEISDGLDDLPVLTHEALTREGIYGNHD